MVKSLRRGKHIVTCPSCCEELEFDVTDVHEKSFVCKDEKVPEYYIVCPICGNEARLEHNWEFDVE